MVLTVTNPNPGQIRVGSLALDTSQGTGGFAVDGGHSGCGLATLSFATQTNGGAGWTVPGSGVAPGDAHQRAVHGDRRGQRLPGRDVLGLPDGGVVKRHLATLAIAVALTFVAATAWAYLSAGSVPGGSGAAAASSVNQGATPTASATGSTVTVSWTATTLANGQAVSGYLVKRYDAGTLAAQTILSACTGTIAATSCVESGVPNGSWKYTVTPVFATNWQGPESLKSATVTVNNDTTAPTNSISLSSVTGGAYLTGTTIYYRGTAAGSLRLTNAVADAGSGPASSATAALGGTTAGWTHTPSTVSAPAGGPYVSAPFSWTAGTTSAPSEAVTGRDVAGNSAVTGLTFTNDSTAPTAGTISYPDGASGQSVSISFTTGTDAGSGIATRRLQRATAPLSGGTCGSWSGFADIGADGPTSPYVDGSLAVACYKYRYVVTDRVGNQDVATSSSVVKVGYGGSIGATPGLLSHWRLGDSPTVPVTTSSDSFTDTSGTLLTAHTGELAAAWTRVLGAANATVSNEGRIFKATTGYSVGHNALVQATPDYSVEADVVDKSVIADDAMGVIGRLQHVQHLLPGELGGAGQQLEPGPRDQRHHRLPRLRAQPARARDRADLPHQARDGRVRPEALRQRGAQGLGHRHHPHDCRAGRHHDRPGRHQRRAVQHHRAAPRQLPGQHDVAGAGQQGRQPRRLRQRRDPRRCGCPPG